MLHGCVESLQSLAGQRPAAAVPYRHGYHHREIPIREEPVDGIQGRLGIEGVETGLYQKHVHSSAHQCVYLLPVHLGHIVEAAVPACRIVHVRRERQGLGGRPYASGHIYPAAGGGILIRHSPGCRRSGIRHLRRPVLQAVVALRDAVGTESIGFDDVGSGLDVFPVNPLYHVRLPEVQHIVVPVGAAGISLNHGAHGSVQDEDSVPGHGYCAHIVLN